MNTRFLKPQEYQSTRKLAEICFSTSVYNVGYYANDIKDSRICVTFDNDEIISMIHFKRMILSYETYEKPVWYICYVATHPSYRRKGIMRSLMNFVLETLKEEGEEFVFLAPVDKNLYTSFGFTNFWKFNRDELRIIYAEEFMEECAMCLLKTNEFITPLKIKELKK